jgi:hypothetical protein
MEEKQPDQIIQTIQINDRTIGVYRFDSEQSLLERIAYALGTLPKYLYVEGDILTPKQVIDLLAEIKKHQGTIQNFIEAWEDKFQPNVNPFDDIIIPLIIYNQDLSRARGDQVSIILRSMSEYLIEEQYINDAEELTSIWDNRQRTIQTIQYKIEQNGRLVEQDVQNFSQLPTETIPCTEYAPDRYILKINFVNIGITNILELFDYVILNNDIPLAKSSSSSLSPNTYFKVLKDVSPDPKWLVRDEGSYLLLKINNRDSQTKKNYTDVYFKLENNQLFAEVKLITEKGYISRETFIERIKSGFPTIGLEVASIDETEVTATFIFPNASMNNYIFADMALNDQTFASLITVNESKKSTKRKGDTILLHAYFSHLRTGRISFYISTKLYGIADSETNRILELDKKTRPDEKEKLEKLENNGFYIRVHFTASTTERANNFLQLFPFLMSYYESKEGEISEIYDSLLDGFNLVTIVPDEDKNKGDKLKYQERLKPLFVSTYSRRCAVERMVTLLTPENKENFKVRYPDRQILKFPRDIPATDPKFPSDGENQVEFVCIGNEYKWPGILRNTLPANKEQFPYAPCCFKENQQREGTNWDIYYHNKPEKKTKRGEVKIKTLKFLDLKGSGVLPEKLVKIFATLHPNSNGEYIRYGASNKSPSSFLSCLLFLVPSLDKNATIPEVEKFRASMKSGGKINIAKQCCYDMTVEEMTQKFGNPSVYFDPKLFVQVLEYIFKVNIFIFDYDGLVLPRFKQGYYRNETYRRSVFILEHFGAESDRAVIPQCELICRQSNTISAIFYDGDPIVEPVKYMFDRMIAGLSLTKDMAKFRLRLPEKTIKPVSQLVDSYGKCRLICVKTTDNEDATLLIDPICPIYVANNGKLIRTNHQVALKIFNELAIGVYGQTVIDNKIVELTGVAGSLTVTIPIEPMDDDTGDQKLIQEQIHYVVSEPSLLQQYDYNKKLAQFLIELTYWRFSHFLSYIQGNFSMDQVLNAFGEQKFIVKEGHNYGILTGDFSWQTSALENKDLIIIPNDETRIRLLYDLRLFASRKYNDLVNFRSRVKISNYYSDISDFTPNPKQLLFRNEDEAKRALFESKIEHGLTARILEQETPYFFLNELDKKIYLVQNTTTKENALKIGAIWRTNRFNIGRMGSPEIFPNISYVLYKDSQIIEQSVGENPVKIILSNGTNQNIFSVLLDL